MNANRSFAGLSVVLLAVVSAQAQGTLQNLNFEQANPVIVVGSQYYPYGVTEASALPYWTVTIGGVPQTQINENAYFLGATGVILLGPGYFPGAVPIDGNYSVLLQGGLTASAASISQTGLIPAGTQSLLFEAQPPAFAPQAGPLEVLIGNQSIPFMPVGTGPNYTLYGANLSAWAGQTEQLTFSALEDTSLFNNWEIDDITFSTTSITPEPSTLTLVLMAGVALGVRRWRAKAS